MAVNYFLEGKSAMIINGPWFVADLKKVFGEELADIGFALIPKVDGKWASPYMTVESVVMTRNAAERGVREEAFKLVRFLTTEGALVLAKEAGHVPAWKAAYEDPDVKGNRVIVAFFEQAKYATPMPNVPEMSVMWQVVPGWLAKVYHGEVTPEEAATNCAKELRDKLASL